MSVPQPRSRSSIALAACSAGVLALAWGAPAFAAQQGPTTVEPAGAAFEAALTGSATFDAGGTVITCSVSVSSPEEGTNLVPEAPDNTDPDGPVSGTISAPGFEDCETNMPLVDAEVTVADPTWEMAMQFGEPSTGTMLVPAGGIVVTTSGLASCTATVSPDADVAIGGTWTNGDPVSTLDFDTTAPVVVEGDAVCPGGDEAVFTATYEVTNVDDPATPITVNG